MQKLQYVNRFEGHTRRKRKYIFILDMILTSCQPAEVGCNSMTPHCNCVHPTFVFTIYDIRLL